MPMTPATSSRPPAAGRVTFKVHRRRAFGAQMFIQFAHDPRHRGDVARRLWNLDLLRRQMHLRRRLRRIAIDLAVDRERVLLQEPADRLGQRAALVKLPEHDPFFREHEPPVDAPQLQRRWLHQLRHCADHASRIQPYTRHRRECARRHRVRLQLVAAHPFLGWHRQTYAVQIGLHFELRILPIVRRRIGQDRHIHRAG